VRTQRTLFGHDTTTTVNTECWVSFSLHSFALLTLPPIGAGQSLGVDHGCDGDVRVVVHGGCLARRESLFRVPHERVAERDHDLVDDAVDRPLSLPCLVGSVAAATVVAAGFDRLMTDRVGMAGEAVGEVARGADIICPSTSVI